VIESLKEFWDHCRENVSYQNRYDGAAHFLVLTSMIFSFVLWEIAGIPSKYGTFVLWAGIGIASLLFWKADKIRKLET